MKSILGMAVLLSTVGAAPAALAKAAHPAASEMQHVTRLAEQLRREAWFVFSSAETQAHRLSYGERLALAALDRLSDDALRFQLAAKRHDMEPERTRSHFRRLVRSYDRASRALRWLQMYSTVAVDFGDVQWLMRRIESQYRG
jgi:hypothetical protein